MVHVDLCSAEAIALLPQQLQACGLSRVDVLVNAAGVLHGTKPDGSAQMPERALREVTQEWLMHNLQINAVAPLLLIQALAPMLKTHVGRRRDGNGGRPWSLVANISARVGSISDNSLGGWYSYRMSKAAQNMGTKTVALELRRQGTLVLGLHPGTVATGLSEPFQQGVPKERLFTPTFSVCQMLRIMDAAEPDASGEVYAWDGKRVPS